MFANSLVRLIVAAACSVAVASAGAIETRAAAKSMGFIGCSMAENIATGYVAVGGQRMWGPYGTGGLVVQSWTDNNSAAWKLFDGQVAKYGKPTAVWVQICIFAQNGATYNEVKQLIANARSHSASGAKIYITGQPVYTDGSTCTLAGANGPALTDNLAKQAGADSSQNVTYAGQFTLVASQTVDSCHATTDGQASLGRQAIAKWENDNSTTTTTTGGPTTTTTTTSNPPTTSNPGCTVAKWGQCGGQGYTGCTTCASGSTCQYSNLWYSQCL